MSCQFLPFPQELRPSLPTIVGNVDYLTLRARLEQIDALLRPSGVERNFVELSLELWQANSERTPSATEQLKYQRRSRLALRCNVLRTLLQLSYREFSSQLAGNPLYQWFCGIAALDVVRVPSKSELQRFADWLPAETMRRVLDGLLQAALKQPQKLGLEDALDLDAYFLDSTCVKANIHFPVDWVLLRDAVRTLMKATLLIRKAGLRQRMEAPEAFLRRMNQLCISMTQASRRSGGHKARKRVLRQMKRLVGTVRDHARRHRELLAERWSQTELTQGQANQILRRIDGVLEKLPRAQKQAHERIIGERPVPNADKLLSLYDPEVRVIVRGKAGAEVEFGNTVLMGENAQGLIVDYAFYRESAPADSQLLFESLLRIWENLGQEVGAVATDRGFASAINHRSLAETEIYDAVCPRKPADLAARLKSPKFVKLQRRRAQTEGRIGILKNGFLGRPLRAQGAEHRELALAWGVLTHNLWKLARLMKPKKKRQPLPKAA
jgi:hypothetical protein